MSFILASYYAFLTKLVTLGIFFTTSLNFVFKTVAVNKTVASGTFYQDI